MVQASSRKDCPVARYKYQKASTEAVVHGSEHCISCQDKR